MNSKQDKEYGRGDDITLLSEIIKNSRYWQEIYRHGYVKFKVNLEHIINFAGFRIISIYPKPCHTWDIQQT